MSVAVSSLVETYRQDGFMFPYDVLDEAHARALREDLEAGEAELAQRSAELALLRSYPDRLLPSFDALIRHPRLIEAASEVLGPDLMVWSAGLFIKEAHTSSFVSWHKASCAVRGRLE